MGRTHQLPHEPSGPRNIWTQIQNTGVFFIYWEENFILILLLSQVFENLKKILMIRFSWKIPFRAI